MARKLHSAFARGEAVSLEGFYRQEEEDAFDRVHGTDTTAIVEAHDLDAGDRLARDHAERYRATLVADRDLKTLLATATPEEHARISETVVQMDRHDEQQHVTRVYQLGNGNPDAARRALESLLPLATFASDVEQGTLLATASARDQEKIGAVVRQMDSAESTQAQLRPYLVDALERGMRKLLEGPDRPA